LPKCAKIFSNIECCRKWKLTYSTKMNDYLAKNPNKHNQLFGLNFEKLAPLRGTDEGLNDSSSDFIRRSGRIEEIS
jgi:hypothetical protein